MIIKVLEDELSFHEKLDQLFKDAMAGKVEELDVMSLCATVKRWLIQAGNTGRLIERWEAN